MNLSSKRIGDSTRLTWDPSPDADVVEYRVYGRPLDSHGFSLLGTAVLPTFDPGHLWADGEGDPVFEYFVVAAKADGSESFFTELVENRSVLVARFSADSRVGDRPFAVQFQDESAGEVSAWDWDFNGDGTIDSSGQYPAYTYDEAGLYAVTLTVGGPTGTDTTVEAGFIQVDPLGDANRDGTTDLLDHVAMVAGRCFSWRSRRFLSS